MTAEIVVALVMLAALVAYAVLAGADFGAGVWDLLSRGPRATAERRLIAEAMGPVWEANHVWFIFLIVLLFTCFPAAYARVSIDLFWPLHLVLVGIVLRGASFVFRAYGSRIAVAQIAWGHVFGAASAITPVLLGMCLGAVSAGGGALPDGGGERGAVWLAAFPALTGILALLLCAYVAALYLAWEASGTLRDTFRRRAIATWLIAGGVSIATLLVARSEAPRLWSGLTSWPALAVVVGGVVLAPVSLAALTRGSFGLARTSGAAQVAALIIGWALAQWPYLVYPSLTIAESAAPAATLRLVIWTLPLGLGVLIPSLWFLFAVFKSRGPGGDGGRG